MHKTSDIRRNALELYAVDNSDVIKVAGIIDKLKKTWHWITDPEFRSDLKKLHFFTYKTEETIKELDEATKELSKAIDAGNLAGYSSALDEVKRLSRKLFEATTEAEETETQIKTEIVRNLKTAPPEVLKEVFPAKEAPEAPQAKEAPKEVSKVESPEDLVNQQAGFDIDGEVPIIDKEYDIPLQYIPWFKEHYTSEKLITITSPNLLALGKHLKKVLDERFPETAELIYQKYLDVDRGIKLDLIKDNIRNGRFIKVSELLPHPREKARNIEPKGVMFTIMSAPFKIPGTDVEFKFKIHLREASEDIGGTPGKKHAALIRSLPINSDWITGEGIVEGEAPEEKEPIVTPTGSIVGNSRLKELRKFAVKGNQEEYDESKTVSQEEFAEIMAKGYEQAFGEKPTLEVLAGGWSQGQLENGLRGSSVLMPNNSIGRIKATQGWIDNGGDFYRRKAYEKTSEGKSYSVPGDRWRAYDSPEEGAEAYWKLLGKDRYKASLRWFKSGDPKSAAVSLGLGGYYTANIKNYAKGLSWRYGLFFKNVAPKIEHLGLKSAKLESPGEPPLLKDFKSAYSKEEIAQATKPQDDGELEESTNTNSIGGDAESWIKSLLAKRESFVEKTAKNNFFKFNSKPNNLLIILNSDNASLIDKIEYARVTAGILRRFAAADVSVFRNPDAEDVELRCSVPGDYIKALNAVESICELIAEAMEKSLPYKPQIKVLACNDPGGVSPHVQLEVNALIQNYRKFLLKRANIK